MSDSQHNDSSATSVLSTSVIICCYTLDRYRDVLEAVHSALDQTQPSLDVIVVVDHNTELYARLKKDLPASVTLTLNDGVKGLSAGRNIGAQAAKGEVLAFLDDDAVAEREWLENLIAPFVDPQVMAVGGRAVPFWVQGEESQWLPNELLWILGCSYEGMPIGEGQVRNVMGCNMAIRADMLSRVGFFNTELGRTGMSGAAEETEISMRLTDLSDGARIAYQSSALVHHKVPPSRLTLRYLLLRSWDEGRSKAILQKTHVRRGKLRVEGTYLRRLLFRSVPRRVVRVPHGPSLAQAAAILLCVGATGSGFAWGMIRGRVTPTQN